MVSASLPCERIIVFYPVYLSTYLLNPAQRACGRYSAKTPSGQCVNTLRVRLDDINYAQVVQPGCFNT